MLKPRFEKGRSRRDVEAALPDCEIEEGEQILPLLSGERGNG